MLRIRTARPGDEATLLQLIQGLAEYEKRPGAVTATPELLRQNLLGRPSITTLLAELGDETAGYAIYYPVFSSFKARYSLYIEDIFIIPALRGRGYGSNIFRYIAREAKATGCTGLQWSCRDWNGPSLAWYKGLGAEIETGVVHLELTGTAFGTVSE